ncbi:hypothetical protein LJC23_04015 [Desulfovibrio sp. OttesenSCG-928-I05]|nr:hypothetical protein [Desulfovibrio sp. OttesenSCG-928-I05]
MTKSQQCASFPRPGRLCRILLLLAMVKLCILGSLLLDPVTNFFNPAFSFVEKKLEVTFLGKEQTPPVRITDSAAPASTSGTPARPVQEQSALSFGPAQAVAAESAPAAAPATDQQSGNLAREALARKEQELARREQDLLNLQREIDDRLEQLQVLEQRITVMLKDAQEVKDEKFRKLVDMLSNMKAKQAANVLETLEESIAVKVLAGMRGRQAGEILTFVHPGKAARLSEALTRMQLPLE